VAKHAQSPELLEEIESGAERLAQWIASHAWLVAGLVLGTLAVAGGVSGYHSWRTGREEAASDALDRARSAYLRAMGASPGSLEVPELANPAAGVVIREEHLERFREVAEAHGGTVAGTLALFEVARLLDELGRDSDAVATVWQEALAGSAANPGLRGVVLQRIAQDHEDAGRWAEAADAHEQAGAIPAFPLRYWALLDAARCRAQAGDPERALALYERVAQEAPEIEIPAHGRAQIRELRAAAGS
jgi:tetratricopeptide (TPR) repeat protein